MKWKKGGPRDGYVIYIKASDPNVHTTTTGLQGKLNQFLANKFNWKSNDVNSQARRLVEENPTEFHNALREFYQLNGIEYPYP